MRKSQIKDIATALIHSAAIHIDVYAFEDVNISDTDIQAIIDSVGEQCNKMLSKVESKYNTTLDTSCTSGIINNIIKHN
ncbi:MAG: hypothetical protein ACRCX2_28170 [Paraclostridium sp.]